jgi:3'-phosphoadenosine 5'-phosphosulfate sulfotransferase (PAPS reductase)/FAD synthetase
MRRFIAFSGGVESTTMALLYGATATPIFSDTGWEHAAMYERIRVVEETLKAFHGEGFAIVKVSRNGERLQDYIAERKFFPSFMARFCTRMFKIEPIDNFLRQYGDEPVELMIGLNADEGDRVGNHGLLKNVTYSYPLLDAGITREKCLEYLDKVRLKPSFPAYMSRGGCVGCFFKSKKEFAAMAHIMPSEAYSVADLEDLIQDGRDRHYGVRNDIPHMRAFLDQATQTLFTADEMYTADDIHTSCGVFCHR